MNKNLLKRIVLTSAIAVLGVGYSTKCWYVSFRSTCRVTRNL